MDFDTYKRLLLSYLQQTEVCEKQDIEDHNNLPDDEKEENGYLIREAVIIDDDGKGNVQLKPCANHTKWRIGDKVKFASLSPNGLSGTVTITDNFEDCICLMDMPKNLSKLDKFSLSIKEPQMTGLFISTIEKIKEGRVGSYYLKELGEIETPELGNPSSNNQIDLPSHLNEEQRKAIIDVLGEPSLYAIQGPPGTGKTDVLATIAKLFSEKGKEVLIISNSHQAVNNALNKVSKYNVPTYKVGNEFKSFSLSPDVKNYQSMWEYKNFRKKRRVISNAGDVLGMTICGAILNLVKHGSAFTPSIVLVDEASQIPLGLGSAIGALEGGTYVFIGDDRQMPPIFHEKMASDPMSVSIFDHLQKILPKEFKTTLTTTYRMNSTICRYVSEQFYEPYGITLTSHVTIANNHVEGQSIMDSVEIFNVSSAGCKDCNKNEAAEVVKQALKYKNMGLKVAVITPYRKQVNLIREEWNHIGGSSSDILVDTVERLQGQDVDVIILSMSVSDIEYYKTQDSFLLDKNRLNVMISRAKIKVVVIKSPIIPFTASSQLPPTDIISDGNGMFIINNEPQEVTKARQLVLESFKDLEFYEDGHRYLLNGKELHSVSTIGHRYLSKSFNADIQAELYASKHGQTAEYWKKQWECNSFKATTLGTKTHEFGESLAYLMAGHPEFIRPKIRPQFLESLNYLADIHPKESAIRLFLNELPSSYHLVLNETKVYSGKNPDETKNLKEQICGTFDMLYWYDGNGVSSNAGFVIFDYKTNATIQDDYNRQNSIMLLPPFDNMYQEPLGEYTIQLSLYSLMLEDIGLKVIDRKLIWLKDDGNYEKIPVPDISEKLRATL